jgi:predicted nucleic acid-binding protein
MSGRALVLDANILIRGVLGKRVLDRLEAVVRPLGADIYEGLKHQALHRISGRDADDWPVLACALALACPVWTEDADFFGTGVATWTTDRVGLYLGSEPA